jgi:FMN-dependent oxidoreductase (nitrilotriacetate monooxygenase family)
MASMHIALYVTETGSHLGGWRHPLARHVKPLDLAFYQALAAKAEKACIDTLFFADKLAIDDIFEQSVQSTIKWRPTPQHVEPLSIMSALIASTSRIGLAGTISSTYNQPYATARALANIDHLSGGRAGWNLVTSVSDGEARNFGKDQHLSHEERYRKAEEFIDVVTRLWDSWQDDWTVLDKSSGVYGNPEKVHEINHKGDFFQVKGPLNVPRPPQGHPVLIQAGVSNNFQRVATGNASMIFTVQADKEKSRAFYQSFKEQVAANGRNPDHVKILPGVVPVIADTTEQALVLEKELKSLVLPQAGLTFMSASMNHDLSQYDINAIVHDFTDKITGSKGRFEAVVKKAVSDQMTFGQLGKWYAESHAFFCPVGTPDQVAEQLALWYNDKACDGFVVLPAYMPGAADDFIDKVIPALQARGVFRTAYPGSTLRDTLGLPVPAL